MGQVEGKVAIVTGGASGIGAACAMTLAREGAKVVVTDLDDAGGQAVVDKIGNTGSEAIFLHQDVSLEESWPGVIEASERSFGRLDVMVANAGIGILCRAVEMSLADGAGRLRSISMAYSCRSNTLCQRCAARAEDRSSSCRQ
jgi:NAD(P)-dependent dehydrogenase (short-subunit alcohol dehydrogenase family)